VSFVVCIFHCVVRRNDDRICVDSSRPLHDSLYLLWTLGTLKDYTLLRWHIALIRRMVNFVDVTIAISGDWSIIDKVLYGCCWPVHMHCRLPSRRRLCSSFSDCLVQPPVHRSTVGSRAYSVAGPQVWSCLPLLVMSAPSLATFYTRLKTFLFAESFPHIQLIWHLRYRLSVVDPVLFVILRPL